MSAWLAFDIGGANLKVGDGLGYSSFTPFPLWKDPNGLHQQLRTLIAEAPSSDRIAITMTGELADCYPSKSAGVLSILEEATEAVDGRHLRIFLSDGKLVTPSVARIRPLQAAASNWRALAEYAIRLTAGEPTILIDIGSTTCDIIPIDGNEVRAIGTTDTKRLVQGELVYTGVERSPICAIVSEVHYRGYKCGVAQELFAQTGDAYILLGAMSEDPANTATADGHPATRVASRRRIGRVICADDTEFNHRDAVQIARQVAVAQCRKIVNSIARVRDSMERSPQRIILSGKGEFLAHQAAKQLFPEAKMISLAGQLDINTSRSAAAHALAVLARERSAF
ncbi:MAG: H4MPT-linked C1 transfer pathway protein [bacterium]|nr:H4MPT-linked C1 transfer pathway protein [bacterium]